jgi:hypothetical protein
MASTSVAAAAAMSDNGTSTEDLLLPGEMPLLKDVIVKALAKPAVWGVGDKKKNVLLTLVANRDALLARVSEACSQDLRATLEKWIPMTEAAVKNQRFKVANVAEHLYKISVVLDAYRNSPFARSMRSDPLNQTFTDIQSMMGQARQDAETTLLDESNSARVKLHLVSLTACTLLTDTSPTTSCVSSAPFVVTTFLMSQTAMLLHLQRIERNYWLMTKLRLKLETERTAMNRLWV